MFAASLEISLLFQSETLQSSLCAPVVELVDAPDSKSGAARRVGSSPTGGTTSEIAV